MRRWQHFEFDWTHTTRPALEVDDPLLVIVRTLGVWSANPLRLRRVSSPSPDRFDVVVTTLEGHMVAGEERFSIVNDGAAVWYELASVSAPASLLSRATFALFRRYQAAFIRASLQRMASAEDDATEEEGGA